jgi:hypothetical protein
MTRSAVCVIVDAWGGGMEGVKYGCGMGTGLRSHRVT